MIVIIDNYDSFTYNLAQYIGELGAEVQVYRNDAVTPEEVEALNPSHIVISPGPGDPSDAGVSREVIRELGPSIPTLGVCLGHQCVGEAFAGSVVQGRPVHGKVSHIEHEGVDLFSGLPAPLAVTRYHSLVVDPTTLPSDLVPLAQAINKVRTVQPDDLFIQVARSLGICLGGELS